MAPKLTRADLEDYNKMHALTQRDLTRPYTGLNQGAISQAHPTFGANVANWMNNMFYGGGKMVDSPARRFEVPLDYATLPGWSSMGGQLIGEELNKGNLEGAVKEAALTFIPGAGPVKGVARGVTKGVTRAATEAATTIGARIGADAARSALQAAEEATASTGRSLTRKGAKPGKNMATLPNIRDLPVEEAVRIARREPHLIPAGAGSPGAYVGGPRAIQSREQLLAMRRNLDRNLTQEWRGGDWYDRYRGGTTEVTGGNPKDADWMSAQHAQYSAGVSPGGELGFAIKDNNANLMGMPTKVARPAQAEAARAAIEANNPELHQLGKKTGEYRKKTHPNAGASRGATGVNDFRHAREIRYTDTGGKGQKDAMGSSQHTFMDYETALAVDRANKAKVGGRSNWTGEQMQAAPWVRQKTYDLLKQRNYLKDRIKEAHTQAKASGRVLTDKEAHDIAYPLAYEDAFQEANKTITEHFPKHTASATYEAIPGASTGHLPGGIKAPLAEREAYTAQGSWANAPGGRDAIYGGLRLGDTGVAGRVRPTKPMLGNYTDETGVPQFNPGEVARPLVGFNTGKDTKTLADADRKMLEGGELLRAYVDAQDAGAAHINITGGKPKATTSLSAPLGRKLTVDELKKAREIGGRYGRPDVVDTGEGVTFTKFYEGPPTAQSTKQSRKMGEEIKAAVPGARDANRTSVDGVYMDLTDEWKQGVGSGAATDKLIKQLSDNPVMYQVYNSNPYIAQNALARLERDEKMAAKWGVVREDIQNARRVIAAGKENWLDRLVAARKSGVVLPGIIGAILYGKQEREPR